MFFHWNNELERRILKVPHPLQEERKNSKILTHQRKIKTEN